MGTPSKRYAPLVLEGKVHAGSCWGNRTKDDSRGFVVIGADFIVEASDGAWDLGLTSEEMYDWFRGVERRRLKNRLIRVTFEALDGQGEGC